MPMPDFNEYIPTVLETFAASQKRNDEYLIGKHGQFHAIRKDMFGMGILKDALPGLAGSAVNKGVVAATSGLTAASKLAVSTGALHSAAASAASHIPFATNAFGAAFTIAPITWAVKPWVAALEVANVAFILKDLYRICDKPSSAQYVDYQEPCTCGERRESGEIRWLSGKEMASFEEFKRTDGHRTCKEVYDYIVSQAELKTIKIAMCAMIITAPLYMIGTSINWIKRKKSKVLHVERTEVAHDLVQNALPTRRQLAGGRFVGEDGCRRAQAIIALLVKELEVTNPSTSTNAYPKTLKTMLHPTGWELVFSAMNR